jgi:hypothetical protein
MEQENRGLQEKYEQDIKSMQDKMNHIMEMIQENPKVGACETGSVGQKE